MRPVRQQRDKRERTKYCRFGRRFLLMKHEHGLPRQARVRHIHLEQWLRKRRARFCFVLFLHSFVLNNVTEHHDVSASHPEIVESLLSRMEEVQRTVFDPDRGLRDLQGACKSLEDNGGFWSPWLTPEELPHEMQLQQMAAVVPGLE